MNHFCELPDPYDEGLEAGAVRLCRTCRTAWTLRQNWQYTPFSMWTTDLVRAR